MCMAFWLMQMISIPSLGRRTRARAKIPPDYQLRLDNRLTKAIKSGKVDASQEDKLHLN